MKKSLALAVSFLAGCVPPAAGPHVPGPADIPRLQAAALRDTADVPARVSLAVAYRASGRLPEARALLQEVVADRPNEAGPVLLLGLTQEESADWAGARASYQRYVSLAAPGDDLRRSIERRLPYVQRQELQAAVRASLAREAELASTPPDPASIAVFPFVLQARDTTLRPLSRALAELLVTDLAMTGRLRVLERAQVQLLLDEIALGRSGPIDPATAARSGRLLRAGRLVQGSIEGDVARLRLGAVVLAAGRDSLSRQAPLRQEAAIAQLFDMEKRLAVSLYGSLGVQLTAAERQRVLQRPTENLQALLAFGRGLEAEDGGDWAAAAAYYRQAVSLDPQFRTAAVRSETAVQIAEAQQQRVEVLVENGVAAQGILVTSAAPPPHPAVTALRSTPLSLGLGQTATAVLVPDPIRAILPDPLQRDPGSEVLGREGIASPTVLRIIFRRPSN